MWIVKQLCQFLQSISNLICFRMTDNGTSCLKKLWTCTRNWLISRKIDHEKIHSRVQRLLTKSAKSTRNEFRVQIMLYVLYWYCCFGKWWHDSLPFFVVGTLAWGWIPRSPRWVDNLTLKLINPMTTASLITTSCPWHLRSAAVHEPEVEVCMTEPCFPVWRNNRASDRTECLEVTSYKLRVNMHHRVAERFV